MKRTLVKKAVMPILMAAFFVNFIFAEDGKSIIQKSLDVKRPKFTHSALSMVLTNAKGEKEERKIEEWAKDPGDKTGAVMIVFKSPARLKDTRFLQIVNKDRANDKWIYLPSLRTVRRIAGAEGSKGFVGTDATYNDIETRKIDQDTHTLLGEEKINGYDCWKIESVSVDPKDSQYSKKISYIDKNTYIPIKAEMYDKKNALLKELVIEKLEQKGEYWIPTKGFLKNVQTNHTTSVEILKLEIDKPIDDKIFTQNFLNTGRM